MKRNRIVINLDSPRPKKSRGRLGRVLLIVALVLVLIAGGLGTGGYFWWRNYQNGPAYSLAVLVDAVQRNDNATFDKMIDVDKISTDFVSQVRDKTAGSLAAALWTAQGDAATAAVSAKIKESLNEQLVAQLRDLTAVAKGKPLFIVALGTRYFASIKQENSTANATVNIKGEVIQLTMQAEDNRWRIVAVKDEKLATIVADAVVKSLPASGSHIQSEMRKQMDKLTK
jgi:uncharacterized membrane protein